MVILVDMNHCSTVVPSLFGQFTLVAWHPAQRVRRKQPEKHPSTDIHSYRTVGASDRLGVSHQMRRTSSIPPMTDPNRSEEAIA